MSMLATDSSIHYLFTEVIQHRNRKENPITLPMTERGEEYNLGCLPATVCCASDLPTCVSDKSRTSEVYTGNCYRKYRHCADFHFPALNPSEFLDSL